MCREQSARLRRRATLRWVVGGGLGLLYLLAVTPLAPVLTGLVAWADGNHQVIVRPGARGLRLVLHHAGDDRSTHRHGWVARALTAMAEPPRGTQPDHVIQFPAGAVAEPAFALAVEAAPDVPGLEAMPLADRWLHPMGWTAGHPTAARPPPDAARSSADFASTVRLL